MTEIPEHLLKRAQAAREKAQADAGASAAPPRATPPPPTRRPPPARRSPRIPAHLLERSARGQGAGGGRR